MHAVGLPTIRETIIISRAKKGKENRDENYSEIVTYLAKQI